MTLHSSVLISSGRYLLNHTAPNVAGSIQVRVRSEASLYAVFANEVARSPLILRLVFGTRTSMVDLLIVRRSEEYPDEEMWVAELWRDGDFVREVVEDT